MTVLKVIAAACTFLDLGAEREILEDSSKTESEKLENEEIKKLYNLMQFALRELCSNYITVVTSVDLASSNCAIDLSNLNNFIKVNGISCNDDEIDFKIRNNKIILPFDDTFTIEYLTYPTITSLENDLDDVGIFDWGVVMLGLSAYYCLACGRFDEFNDFHAKYVLRAESIRTMKSFNLPMRRWE